MRACGDARILPEPASTCTAEGALGAHRIHLHDRMPNTMLDAFSPERPPPACINELFVALFSFVLFGHGCVQLRRVTPTANCSIQHIIHTVIRGSQIRLVSRLIGVTNRLQLSVRKGSSHRTILGQCGARHVES